MTATNHTTPPGNTLLLSQLKEIYNEMARPKPPEPVMFVVTPLTKERLDKFAPPTHMPGIEFPVGIPICIKNDQKRDCWAFSDMKMARQYLNGEISESYLEVFLASQTTP